MYFPAITAVRCNADVKALYDRLLERGKLKMLAIGATMKKLVHIFGWVVLAGSLRPTSY
jgi:hypothetical protein